MKHKVTFIYIVLFLLICAASVIILRHENKPIVPVQKTNISSYVLLATYTEYNKQGDIKAKIFAEKITHFQPQETTLLTKPRIISYTDNRTPWHIHADTGTSDKTGEKIILQGHVIVHELPMGSQPEMTITTTELTLFPKKSRAVTQRFVTLTRPGMVIHGAGLIANLKTGEYQLRSESKAVYQPQKK